MGGLESIISKVKKEIKEYDIEIDSVTGEKLAAKLFVPCGENNCTGILMNGGMFLDPLKELAFFSKFLAKTNYVVLVPRYIGHAHITAGIMDREDCATAFRKLMECTEVNPEKCGMIGFSYGAALSLLGAAHQSINKDIDFVISHAGFTDVKEMLKHVLTDSKCDENVKTFVEANLTSSIMQKIRSELDKPENRYKLAPESRDTLVPLFNDLAMFYSVLESPEPENVDYMLSNMSDFSRDMLWDFSPINHLESILCRTLLIHGKQDHIIPVNQAERMYRLMKKSGKNVDLILLEGVGHAYIRNIRGFFHYLVDERSTIGNKISKTIKGEE